MKGSDRMKKLFSTIAISFMLLGTFLPIQTSYASSSYTTYKVKKGDTLYNLSKKYKTSTKEMMTLNHLKTTALKINQLLKVPVAKEEVKKVSVKTPVINEFPNVSSKNYSDYTLNGTGEKYATINILIKDKNNKIVTTTKKADAKGIFKAELNLQKLADGTLTIIYSQKITSGFSSISTNKIISKDTIAPSVTSKATDITKDNQEKFVITGNSEKNSYILISVSDGKKQITGKSLMTDSKGNFSVSLNVSALADNKITVQVYSKDSFGNEKLTKIYVNKNTKVVEQPAPPAPPVIDPTVYTLDAISLAKWGIYNDDSHPVETTKGINDALNWTHDNGFTTLKVPEGNYLISLVSDTTLELDAKTVFEKETNGYEQYSLIYVGPLTKNATVKGGTLIGDRETHDYTQKQTEAGTHEWGYGVNIAGGRNITIEGMKIEKFTGDGIAIGGSTIGGGGTITSANFESGGLDANGNETNQTGKIRSIEGITITNFSRIKNPLHKIVNIWLPKGLSSKDFDVCYYRADNSFISCDKGRIYSKYSIAPTDADHYRIAFDAASTTGAEAQWMVIENAKGVIIKDNDIGYNRRQGITAGGEDVQIINNKIHDTSGTAPQSGIDIEPGFFPARGFLIKGNDIYNNKIQTVLAYGNDATFDSNTFRVDNIPGSIGLYVWAAYDGITVNNNKFIGTGLSLNPVNAMASGNQFINSSATINGSASIFKNGVFTDSGLSVNGIGTQIFDTTITNTGANATYKGSLSVGKDPNITITNVTLKGTPASKITLGGYSDISTVFDNLNIVDGISGTTGLPSGTYKNSSFSYTGDKTSGYGVQYGANVTIDHSSFKNTTLSTATTTTELTVKNSDFTFDGDLNNPAVYMPEGKNVTVLNNTFTALHLTGTYHPIVKFGQYAWTTHDAKVFGGTVSGNTIYTNSNVQEKGIHTTEAGIGAPKFTINDNILYNAKLMLKSDDLVSGNQELTK
jgi:LysM repeat protein